MSCFIVSDKHISAIVRWACVNNRSAGWVSPAGYAYRPGGEQAACDILYTANVKSVNARYGEGIPETGCLYTDAPLLTPVEVIKLIDGLMYQCDEWDGFAASVARQILDDIRNAAIGALPGYASAKWTID